MSAHHGHNPHHQGDHHHHHVDAATPRRALWWVLGLNGGMAVVEGVAGWWFASQSLKADALDFAADAITYGVTLLALGLSLRTQAWVALIKGLTLGVSALAVLLLAVYRLWVPATPLGQGMVWVALAALAANLASVALLAAYANNNLNLRSAWLCTRNDAIGNVAVLVSGALVWWLQAPWPDLLLALGLAGLFAHSCGRIVREARHALA